MLLKCSRVEVPIYGASTLNNSVIQISAYKPLGFDNPFYCSGGYEVIPTSSLCDGIVDCLSGEDEDSNFCGGKSEE